MNIRNALSEGHSKEIRDQIVFYVGHDPQRMKELMDCFFDKNIQLNQRSSWPLGIIGRRKPQLLEPYHQQLMDNLDQPLHDAVIRNTVRIYEDIFIPESIEGELCSKSQNGHCNTFFFFKNSREIGRKISRT